MFDRLFVCSFVCFYNLRFTLVKHTTGRKHWNIILLHVKKAQCCLNHNRHDHHAASNHLPHIQMKANGSSIEKS